MNKIIMRRNGLFAGLLLVFLVNFNLVAQNKVIPLEGAYNKIIVSPHIETVFVEGEESIIEIKNLDVFEEKFKYELKNKTLHIYLEGAKTVTKNKKVKYNNGKRKVPIYRGTKAQIVVKYTPVKIFSIRGEEDVLFKNLTSSNESKIRLYGASKTTIENVKANKLRFTIYGDSKVTVDKGVVDNLKVTAYGEAKFMATNLETKETKVTSYGAASFKLNVSDRLKVTAYGEAKVLYKGNATVKKGIVIGRSTIKKVD
ncbi:DUF2807 domain-containing protein [uncultured Tenacibaculum sp.]|uniref:GIN domain-containing protein n=1 Tax=uncultured Tenacibaculum sp. TaxID=174713 RepID=UPI0026211CB7|nr:DUF2807 domain-containing protein [uncultured Tenacibaculum sp.]